MSLCVACKRTYIFVILYQRIKKIDRSRTSIIFIPEVCTINTHRCLWEPFGGDKREDPLSRSQKI